MESVNIIDFFHRLLRNSIIEMLNGSDRFNKLLIDSL